MFEEILNDRESGASVLLEKTLSWMAVLLEAGMPLPPDAMFQLMNAHRGMACFHHLHRYFGENALTESSLGNFRRGIRTAETKALRGFTEQFSRTINHVAVYSNSGIVVKALASLKRPLGVTVALCAPEGEGRAMAESLTAVAEIRPLLLPDGVFFSRIERVEAVVLGCDAISPGWFVNRSGTGGLVRLALAVGVPVFLVPGPLKALTDEELLQLPLKEGDALSDGLSGGVSWENPMLEKVRTEGVQVIS